jgi:hypothetical protein
VIAAREFGFPVALKIQADDILHKSDVGGVVLNIADEDEVRQSFEMILHKVSGLGSSRVPIRPANDEDAINRVPTVGRKVNAVDGLLVSTMRPER